MKTNNSRVFHDFVGRISI